MGESIPNLLAAWRSAARALESADPSTADKAAGDVIRAWLAYQEATLAPGRHEFLLVADDDHRYVAASAGVTDVLGYRPSELIGMGIDDLASADLRDGVSSDWARFLDDGSQEGEFVLRAADGSLVPVTFHARINHPIPGVHASRLRPVAPGSRGEDSRPREMVSRMA